MMWPFRKSTPTATVKGAEVTAVVSPPIYSPDQMIQALQMDRGQKHSRLWIHFQRGAIEGLRDELHRTKDEVRKIEIEAEIEVRKVEIALHSALHPSDADDARFLKEHIDSAKGNN